MSILKPLSGLLLLFIGIQAQSQADLNDFLRGQVVGSEIFMEYDYQAMLDSIDVLNAGTSSSSTPASTLWGVYTLRGADIDGEAAGDLSGQVIAFRSPPTARGLPLGRMVTALTPVTFVFTPGIAVQLLGNSKALTSTAKRLVIIAAIAFHFPPTARRLPLGRMVTALTPVTFVFTPGIAPQVLGNSKAMTSTAKRRVIIAAIAFPFPPTAP